MTATTHVQSIPSEQAPGATPPGEPCIVVIFGASGDLTKRLLMPAFYNLACDGLLSKHFAIIGMALDDLTTDQFRARMTEDIKKFHTRRTFDESVWQDLVARLNYTPGNFGDPEAYRRLADAVAKLDAQYQAARQRPLLHGDAARRLRPDLRPPRRGRLQEARQGLDAPHRRKALRPRSAVGTRAEPRAAGPLAGVRRFTGSTTTSARRRSRTSSPSASPTASSSRCGTRTTSTTSSSRSPRRSASRAAANTTTAPASSAT